MTMSFDELTRATTKDEVKASIYGMLATLGVDTTSWLAGSVVRTIVTVFSVVIGAGFALQSLVARQGFLELSSDAWLTWVAYYVYGVTRIDATFAAGSVTLTNSGGGVYTLGVGDLVVSNVATGKTYRNTSPFTLAALSTLAVAVEAIESGSASTATPGTLTKLQTALLGVTVTNPTSVVGRDAELDPELRLRCYEKLGSLSPNGPWDAYGYAARNAARADGSTIGVTRVRINKDGYGNVWVYCASATGGITGTAGDPTTDIGAINLAVQQRATPLCVTANVLGANAVAIAITYQVWAYNNSGLTPAQLQAAIASRLTAFMSSQPIGGNVIGVDAGKVFVDAIRAAIASACPQIFHVVVVTPAADVSLSIGDVPALGTVVNSAMNLVAPSEGSA